MKDQRRSHAWLRWFAAGACVAVLASCSASDAGGEQAGPALTFCEAMSQPLELGVVSPRDFMSSELDAAVERFSRGGDRVDLMVFLNANATEAAVADVRASIETIPFVTIASFVDKDQALAEFREMFADRDEVLDSITRDEMPTSFRIVVDKTDPLALRSVRDDFESRLDESSAIFEILDSPELRLGPATLENATLSQLLLELPLQTQLYADMWSSSTATEVAAVEALIAATGARYEKYDKARAYAEFQARSPVDATEYDQDDMSVSFRVEYAPGLQDLSDSIEFDTAYSFAPIDGESLVSDLQRRLIGELLSRPAASQAQAAAGNASPTHKDTVEQLAAVGDVEEQYELASDLRDFLTDECALDINVSDQTRPLNELMDSLRAFEISERSLTEERGSN